MISSKESNLTVIFGGHHWIVWVFVISMFTFVLTDNINNQFDPTEKPLDYEDIDEILKSFTENTYNSVADDDNDDNQVTEDETEDFDDRAMILQSKTRKSSSTRPKYNPGLKWIGLGKRHTSQVPIGPELFTDLRRFFNAAQKSISLRRGHGRSMSSILGQQQVPPPRFILDGEREHYEAQDRRATQQQLKFMTRSSKSTDGDNGQTQKHHYNPSLLWTGLGR